MINIFEILEIKDNIILMAKYRYEQANNGRTIVFDSSSICPILYESNSIMSLK